MPDTLTEPLPHATPHEKHARLEVDAFCVECGYNLHSQAVVRDERLGIFVCRCPECGRFHPAGVGVTATNLWLRRLGTMLLAFWVLIVLFTIFWIVVGLGAIQVGFVESFSYHKMITTDGRDVEWNTNPNSSRGPGGRAYQAVLKGTTQPVLQWRMVSTLQPQQGYSRRTVWDCLPFALAAPAMGFVTGVLLVVFFWHWKRRRYLLVLIVPLAVAAVVSTIFCIDEMYELIRPFAVRMSFGWAMAEVAGMGLGILAGRPIARTFLRMFIPPRPRQHFAFLWSADGKAMPPARV
jgi:hypothetical protein